MPFLAAIRRRSRRLLPELARYGAVGVAGLLVDVGGFNALRYLGGEGALYHQPVTAKLISASVATLVSWLGNRYWTFRGSRRAASHRELLLVVVICTIGTGIATACLATSHYVLGLTSPVADNISANAVGLVLATSFRFWSYRTHVFNERPPGTA